MREVGPSCTILEPPSGTPRTGATTEALNASRPLSRVNGEESRLRKWHPPSWAVLLERFYVQMRLPLPRIEQLKGDDVPEPYRSLLVHSSDMTPTLEGFYHRPMDLTVLSRETANEEYFREVVLKVADEGRPVEYGVIRICLSHLPGPARQRVLQAQRPLGSILQTEGIPHISWPQAFFRVRSDAHTSAVLRLRECCDLYGRRNVLLDGSRRLLAEVIEILAPSAPNES
jgi:chorismate-pyruvate lyase